MDAFAAAGEAIEEMVRRNHPADSNNWAGIIPKEMPQDGWGLELAEWAREEAEIVDFLTALIGRDINIPENAIRNSWDQPLDSFQKYLAAKIDYQSVALSYHRSRALLLEFE